jgi:branched-chain amino acid transport system ATP-binding protein/nonpolar-amino-acid-transporting ATPase
MFEIRNLKGGYGGLNILNSVSLRIDEGDSAGLIGANGAGKTTLVRAISGLVRPTAGTIMMDGRDVAAIVPYRLPWSRIAVVLENRCLFDELSIRDNLMLAFRVGRKVVGRNVQFDLDQIFELFPFIAERVDSPVGVLSGGQQQMVAIARALLLQPRLLIMDEPSTGLAPVVVKDILAVLKQLREDHDVSMLLVEQNVAIASEMTSRCYVMSLGSIVHEIHEKDWRSAMNTDSLLKAYLGN